MGGTFDLIILLLKNSRSIPRRIRFDQCYITFKNDTIDNLMHIVENFDQKLIESFEMFANSFKSKIF